MQVLSPHPGTVTCLALSPDKRWLASAARGGKSIRIWDLATGERTHMLTGKIKRFDGLGFTNDGTEVLGLGGTRRRHLWNLDTGELTDRPTKAKLAPRFSRCLWRFTRRALVDETGEVLPPDFNIARIAPPGYSGHFYDRWGMSSERPEVSFFPHPPGVDPEDWGWSHPLPTVLADWRQAVMPWGKELILVSSDGEKANVIRTIRMEDAAPIVAANSADGTSAAVGCTDNRVRLLSVGDDRVTETFDWGEIKNLSSLEMSADRTTIAVGGTGKIVVWDIE